MNAELLHYGRQSIDRSDVDAVLNVLQSDLITQGPVVERFESALAERVNARHAVAVSSGTAALHIAALAAGLAPGDIGVTSALTFVASANCVRYTGGDVALVDIDPDTLGMAPLALKALLAEQQDVKAVIPVHMGGVAHASDEIRALAQSRCVIEDAAHSLGGSYACGRPVGCGAYSDMSVFSFHPVKSITTAEGGAVVTNDDELARRLRLLRNHGIERNPERFVGADCNESGRIKPWLYEAQMLGFNYRMTDLHAALGLSQLKRLDSFIARRRTIALRYDEAFRGLPHMRLPQSAADQRARSALHLYIAEFDFAALNTTRVGFMSRLERRQVRAQVHYIPVYRHPYYQNRFAVSEFPNIENYYRGCLSLPLYPALTDEDVERVILAVTGAVAEA
jgi:UDP-4-amino-4,6-dideoxy-N-acetyl-beta-L-altrosamine transaminase